MLRSIQTVVKLAVPRTVHSMTVRNRQFQVHQLVRRSFAAYATGPGTHLDGIIEYNFDTIVEMSEKSVAIYPNNSLFGTWDGKGFDYITHKEFHDMVKDFRVVLKEHGVGKGDKVAIICNNCVQWAVGYIATAGVGAAWVPMYESQLQTDWEFILENSDSKFLLVANDNLYERVKHYKGKLGKLEHIMIVNSADKEAENSYTKWMHWAKTQPPVPPVLVTKDDLLSLTYTSGTTGNPKGVMLSHGNIVSNLESLKDNRAADQKQALSLSYLPWAHIYGQTCELNAALGTGSAMAIVPSRDKILECLQIVKPSVLVSVPLLLNRIYDGVIKKVMEGTPLRQKIFFGALAVSRARNILLMNNQPIPPMLDFKWRLADKVVFSKIRAALGGNFDFMSSGGAASSLNVMEFFEDIGIPICEGYGLTETSPVVTAGSKGWERRRMGFAGVVLKGCSVKIINPETLEVLPDDQEGEICAGGGNVMQGYYKNPDATKEVIIHIDGVRYFRTGDIGLLHEGKFLKVTGRIKEQFKLLNGKFVVPAPLEDAMCRSPFIAQSFIYGDNKNNTVCLISPDLNALTVWLLQQKYSGPGMEGVTANSSSPPSAELMNSPENTARLEKLCQQDIVINLLSKEIGAITAPFRSYEKPQKWVAMTELFTPDNQMLTPKMSIRRNNVLKRYQGLIDDMYTDKTGHRVVC